MTVTPLLRVGEQGGRQTLAETLRLQLDDEIVRGSSRKVASSTATSFSPSAFS